MLLSIGAVAAARCGFPMRYGKHQMLLQQLDLVNTTAFDGAQCVHVDSA